MLGLGGPSKTHVGDPLYGGPSKPIDGPSGSHPAWVDPTLGKGTLPPPPNDNLNRSYNQLNNTYLDETSWRGDGANVISDRLNFGGAKKVIEGAPQIHYVPKEIVKVIEEEEIVPAPAVTTTYDDSININGRNILAESMAKVALLIMENNRLKWVEAQRNAEITRLRAVPVPAVVKEVVVPVQAVVHIAPPPLPPAPVCCPACLRPYPPGWTGPIQTVPSIGVVHTLGAPVMTTAPVIRASQTYVTGGIIRQSGTTTVAPVVTNVGNAYPTTVGGVTSTPTAIGGARTLPTISGTTTTGGPVIRKSSGYATTTTPGVIRTSGTTIGAPVTTVGGVYPTGTTPVIGGTTLSPMRQPGTTPVVGGASTSPNYPTGIAGSPGTTGAFAFGTQGQGTITPGMTSVGTPVRPAGTNGTLGTATIAGQPLQGVAPTTTTSTIMIPGGPAQR